MGRILVLAGVNGAGKSSLLGSMLEEDGAVWYNPDSFTQALVAEGFALDDANALAWKHGVQLLREAVEAGSDYAFETTLGANTIPRMLKEACAENEVVVWFCGLESPELHIERVATRVAAGGHDIPEAKIRQRYDSSRSNLIGLIPVLSALHVYDNSQPAMGGEAEPRLVLEMRGGTVFFPVEPDDVAATPAWAKPIVMAAIELKN